ncbi:Prodigiosin synthesizing transferase PigC [Calidithermus terrae]|uniref:Prodigiosin synthesizing transferase PigC n=2 Tax=Calidithermus terrae TaxID=1408545 RepID=A0A399DYV3_9DEIN|nr:Prodigiosin synthesizing transferase PigC [Calidithermus terrae]
MVSAEPAERLRAMAARVRGNPDLIGRLEADPAAALREHPELEREFRAYLERFGDRCLDELKLESPTLTDQPELLARTVAQLARAPESPASEAEARRRAAEARALGQLSGWRRRVFAYVLREARARVRGRENLRFERTRVFGEARRLFRAMGQRLRAMGRLEHEDDVFYLTVEEILGYAEGTAVSLDLRGLAALRKAEFERHRAEGEPPRRFRSLGSVYEAEPVGQEAEGQGAELRRGLACSPGRVRGGVRVILDPRAARLEEPAVLVAPRTDPGWILVLPLARGLIVERGSLLSHSAIVARELGIPCVVGLDGATRWLRDGDEVELDGSAGTVRLLKAGVSP